MTKAVDEEMATSKERATRLLRVKGIIFGIAESSTSLGVLLALADIGLFSLLHRCGDDCYRDQQRKSRTGLKTGNQLLFS